MYGITFNDKHSDEDFGFYVESKVIQSPAKKKIKIDVPGMNGDYDFSTVNSNGEITYDTRDITVNFGIATKNKQLLYIKYTKLLAWLLDAPKSELIFDDIRDYYFIAEVEQTSTLEEVLKFGKVAVKFIADPFKTGVDYAMDNLWDTFNFEEDYLQDGDFDIVGTKTVTIYNPGRFVIPTINVNAAMSIIYNNITYNLVTGDNKVYGFKLVNGANSLVINGSGHIKFLFRKRAI